MHEKLDLHAIFSVFTKHVHVKMDVVALKSTMQGKYDIILCDNNK